MTARTPVSASSSVVGRGGVVLAVWVLVVAALAAPLVAAGWWTPWGALVVLVAAAVVAVVAGRQVPVPDVPRPAAALLVLVALTGAVWAGATHAEHVVLRRDAGTYALFGQHLATAHRADVDVSVSALGGATTLDRPDVTVGSPGYYAKGRGSGTHVVPQFLLGAPVWLSVGWWLGGWTGLLLVPALALGAALLAFAGLATRVVGPWWAVAATAMLTLAQPVLHAGRSTYSEPLALLAGCAGAAVLVAASGAAREGRGMAAGRLALLAGLLLGGVALVRVDGLRETALLLPAAALLAVGRQGVGGRLVAGLAASTALAGAVALGLSRPYLGSIAGSLVPLSAAVVALAVVSVAVVVLARRGVRVPGRVRARVPAVLAGVVAVAGLALATRPWWQTVRQSAADPGSRVVAGLQLQQGLAVDGGRTYAEHSVQWVAWWLGVPALVLALATVVALAHRAARRWADDEPLPDWTAVALVAFGSVVLTLYRPGITPDHPWADRRLVPVVLPAVVLLAVAGVRGGVRWLGRRQPGRASSPVPLAAAAMGVALLLVPAALATAPLAGQRTERGEVSAVQRACAAFGPTDTAILVDSRAANEWTQLLRGVCDVPTVVVRPAAGGQADAATVVAVARAVAAAGRVPVVASAGSAAAVARLGAAPRHAVHLATTEDQRLLTRRPRGGAGLAVDLWVGRAT